MRCPAEQTLYTFCEHSDSIVDPLLPYIGGLHTIKHVCAVSTSTHTLDIVFHCMKATNNKSR